MGEFGKMMPGMAEPHCSVTFALRHFCSHLDFVSANHPFSWRCTIAASLPSPKHNRKKWSKIGIPFQHRGNASWVKGCIAVFLPAAILRPTIVDPIGMQTDLYFQCRLLNMFHDGKPTSGR